MVSSMWNIGELLSHGSDLWDIHVSLWFWLAFSLGLPKVELRSAVEEVVKETPEYRCMQSQFSVLYNESLQLKAHLDEARTLLHGTRGTHQRQVELIEVTANFSLFHCIWILHVGRSGRYCAIVCDSMEPGWHSYHKANHSLSCIVFSIWLPD